MAMEAASSSALGMTPDLFAFEPEACRTRAVDHGIRAALADSVRQVLREAERFGFRSEGDLDVWTHAVLTTERAPPQLWAAYHALVQAIGRGDDGAVCPLIAELLARAPGAPAAAGTVLALCARDLGARDAARYTAILDSDPGMPLGLVGATPAEVARIAANTAEARGLLAEACPALLDEIDALGHQIVLATSGDGDRFGGAACIFVWGAVAINPARVPDRVTLVEALAHETAHALLFGLTLGVDLTLNDPAERYASPLRRDPRPIEGIVHATYVLARMVYALGTLRGSSGRPRPSGP